MTTKRILIATDVPFWRQSTGAEQRINSLVQCLHNQGHVVEFFFVAGADSATLRNDLQKRCQFPWLIEQIKFYSSSDSPEGLVSKIAWHAKGLWHWLFAKSQSVEVPQESMRLEDFAWPWARVAFENAVRRFGPNAVIIEYVKLGYLLDAKSMRGDRASVSILDSHDLLHRRYQGFKARGEVHWIEITEQEEAAMFRRFDSVIAIQENEAQLIKKMAPETEVLVCTHACFPDGLHAEVDRFCQRDTEGLLRLGILSSNNPANRSAISNFISDVWGPSFSSQTNVRLLIAGSVCDGISKEQRPSFQNIRWDRKIDSPSNFYQQVDVVVNPIEFGSGLKIKNVESLAHGKPVITTPHGATGFVEGPADGVFIVETSGQWQEVIEQLLSADELRRFSEAARSLSQNQFSEVAAYGDLLRKLASADNA